MKVNALDHINIVAADLDQTARFYADLFGLDRRDAPSPLTAQDAQWMCDSEGRPILHINSATCPRPFDRVVIEGPTGAIHHIALNCSGYTAMLARIDARKMDRTLNTVESAGLRQIFVKDPNEILLELNFFAE